MSLIRKHVAVLQAWACLALVMVYYDLNKIKLVFDAQCKIVILTYLLDSICILSNTNGSALSQFSSPTTSIVFALRSIEFVACTYVVLLFHAHKYNCT